MIRLNSIKAKSAVYSILIVIIPMLIVGTAGILYYQGAIRQNIQNDCLEQAKTVAALTSNYVERGILYLERKADSSQLIDAVSRKDVAGVETQLDRIGGGTNQLYWIFATDEAGNVLASQPYGSFSGANIRDTPYFTEPMRTGKSYFGATSEIYDRPAVLASVPISKNGTATGVLIGAFDKGAYLDIIYQIESGIPYEYIYLVDETGRIAFHNNREYMLTRKDFSELPIIQKVKTGGEGVQEFYNPIEKGDWVGAYSPVPDYGWGAVVSMSLDDAYRPVNNSIGLFVAALLIITLLAASLAFAVGHYLTNPISRISAATVDVSKGREIDQDLPYGRDDELGQLARAFKRMSDNITDTREKMTQEKKRADLYIDIMGHDITNLSQVILSNLDIIQQHGHLNDIQQECLTGATGAVNDSAGLIKNVKAIQAVTTGNGETVVKDIDELIQACTAKIHPPDNKKVNIDYQPRKGRIIKAVPEVQLAFCNVIDNSVKHSGSEVTIDIKVDEAHEAGGKFYDTTITDNGVGIPEGVKKTLFTRFQEGLEMMPGRGLGLYTVKLIAEKSGGSLRIEDRVPGDHTKGTRVTIRLLAARE